METTDLVQMRNTYGPEYIRMRIHKDKELHTPRRYEKSAITAASRNLNGEGAGPGHLPSGDVETQRSQLRANRSTVQQFDEPPDGRTAGAGFR